MSHAFQPVVLLVEDDPGDVLMVTEALERGIGVRDVQVAFDGQEALDFLHRAGEHAGAPRPDLILLDLNMPRLDGRQVLEIIKIDPVLRAIPVVVFTTSAADSDVISCYDRHANAYVTKPLGLDALDATVKEIGRFYTSVCALPLQGHSAG